MADIEQNIIDLTETQMLLVKNQLRRQLMNDESKEAKLLDSKIKSQEKYIVQMERAIKVGEKTTGKILQEIEQKDKLIKQYDQQKKFYQQAGLSVSEYNKKIQELQRTMQKVAKEQGLGIDLRNKNTTFGTLWKDLKDFKFGQVSKEFSEAGRYMGVFSNTVAALGGPIGATAAAIGILGTATNKLYNTFVATSARMHNAAAQIVGIGAESRNLFGGNFLMEWANRQMLGFSAEQQQEQFSAIADVLRLNPNTNKQIYEQALSGFQQIQRIWGTDTKTLSRIDKAFRQTGMSAEQMAPKFDTLMRSIEGTGFTTNEFTNFLAQDSMYLKNFGVNLDTYSKELMRYGNLYRQERISAAGLRAGGFQGEQAGNLAYLAEGMLRSGVISETELGAGLGSSIMQKSGAMREYLGKGITVERISKIYDYLKTQPEIYNLLKQQGAFESPQALKESLTQLNIPGLGTVKDVLNSMTAQDLYKALELHNFQTTTGKGGLTDYSPDKLKKLAEEVTADTSDLIERLLRQIAQFILETAGMINTKKQARDMSSK